ncbi:MAG: glycosyltransferase family 2 protein [Candidatus Andersenbacteria bacterium]|nr:glycosyltransferase family 2 protein [Candidatus Andersenbacteria bacterium]
MSISLVIPAYNEEKRIVPFLESISRYISANPGQISEVLVVDDGSTDTTEEVAKQAGSGIPRFAVISQPKNMGKGAAVKAGVMAATGDHVVFMDADGATDISELPKMIAALEGYDIAIGSRWLPGSIMERHSALRSLSGYMNRAYMKLFGFGDIDTMCGFKGYRKEVAQDLYKDLEENRWLFDTEIAYRSIRRGYTTHNFPIAWESKDGSKLDTATLIKSALAIFPLIIRISKQEKDRVAAVA